MRCNPLLVVDFKSSTLYAIRIVIYTTDTDLLKNELGKHIKNSGDFFKNEAIILDVRKIKESINWPNLLSILHSYKIPIIGILAEDPNRATAIEMNLISLELVISPKKKLDSSLSPLTITKSLRSGQHIYAQYTDLIVIGMVSQGAEVIADGNIHIYGPLRGKAIAGANGDKSKRIFTTQLNAELLSIAGIYRMFENKFDYNLYNQPALIELIEGSIKIRSL